MRWRVVALLLAAIVAGCVTDRNGMDFAAMSQKIGQPRAGEARVVVFREDTFAGSLDGGWDVKLDDQPMSALKTGTYVIADRPAGRHQLSCLVILFPGETRSDITVLPGHTHFFLARPSARSHTLTAMSAAGGLVGLAVGSALTSGDSNPGPIDFFPMEETAARTAIASLKLAE